VRSKWAPYENSNLKCTAYHEAGQAVTAACPAAMEPRPADNLTAPAIMCAIQMIPRVGTGANNPASARQASSTAWVCGRGGTFKGLAKYALRPDIVAGASDRAWWPHPCW
jgi:hypothetical protein